MNYYNLHQQLSTIKTMWVKMIFAIVVIIAVPLYVSGAFTDNDSTDFNSATQVGVDFDTSNQWMEISTTTNVWDLPNNSSSDWIDMSNNVLLYHMEEDNGDTSFDDDSNTGNNGTCTDCSKLYIDGQLSMAQDFNGVGNYVEHDGAPSFVSDTSGTVMAWVAIDDLDEDGDMHIITASDEAGSTRYMVFLGYENDTDTFTIIQRDNDTADELRASVPLSEGLWHHVAVVSNGSSYTMYVDGEVQTLSVQTGSNSGDWIGDVTGIDNFTIGASKRSSVVSNFDGQVDEVAVFSEALSATVIQQVYDRQKSKFAGFADSRIYNAGSNNSWGNIIWHSRRPSLKQLANAADTDEGYATGSIDMTGNVLMFHMDESSGTIADSSQTGNNGTGNAITYGGEGIFNGAIEFDGATSYITADDSASLDISGDLSIIAWIRAENPSQQIQQIVSKYDAPGGQRAYQFNISDTSLLCNPGELILTISSQTSPFSGAILCSHPLITSNTWHHVAGTFDASEQEMKVFIDGEDASRAISFGSPPSSIANSTRDLAVGAGYGDGGSETPNITWMKGELDEVGLFNRTLSPNEIRDIYLRGANRLKFQVRSCNDAACAGEGFIGPDGTSSTYYSEEEHIDDAFPNITLTNVGANQYFQYRMLMESDTSTYTPEVYSVDIDQSVATLSNVQAGASATLALNDQADVTSVSMAGTKVVRASTDSTRVLDVETDFSASNTSWSNVSFDTNSSTGQAYAHDTGSGSSEILTSYTLYVPKLPSHNQVRVCSGATSLGCDHTVNWSFLASAAGTIIDTNGGFDTSGIGVSVVADSGVTYWKITGLTGTGGEGEGGAPIPEMSDLLMMIAFALGLLYVYGQIRLKKMNLV